MAMNHVVIVNLESEILTDGRYYGKSNKKWNG